MKKKNAIFLLGTFSILCFATGSLANATDYITYGNVKASFNAYYNGGMAITLQGQNELDATHLPAILGGMDGRIIPWIDDQVLRYEDAKGIWSSYLISELDLNFWANYFGFTYDTLNEGCKYFMSWFHASYYLNGEELDVTTTPLKRGQFYIIEMWGDEILWWFSDMK